MFLLHGAFFLNLKTEGVLRERALAATKRIGPLTTVAAFLFVIATPFMTDAYARLGLNPGIVPISAAGGLLAAGWLVHQSRMGWAFVLTCLTIALSVITVFMSLFPRVMVSSLNPDWSLTIYNASSSGYTLMVMTIVALIFVPIVLLYQGWSYWVFRKRISTESELTY
jgi:cytochrome d ubiquinol oxidase subunit II